MTDGHEHELLTRYFDGEVDFADLPPELQREAREFERTMDVLAAEEVRAPMGVKAAVMERVRAAGEPSWSRLFGALVMPKRHGFRAAAVGLAVAGAAAAFVVLRLASPNAPSPVVVPPVVATVEGDRAAEPPPAPVAPSESVASVRAADPSRLAERVDAETLAGVSPILAAAERDSLPLIVLERRALEGSVKGQAPEQIVAAVEQLAERLRTARALLREGDPETEPVVAEITAAAQALEQGVPTGTVTALVEDMPAEAGRAVPLALMGDLVTRGISTNEVGSVVAHLVSLRIPETRLTEIAPQMDVALRVVPQPRAALSQALRGMGIPDAPRPTIRQEF